MTEIRRLNAHDPLPGGHAVVVMQRMDEDVPDGVTVEMIVHHASGAEETSRPVHPDGRPMSFEEAVAAALPMAERQGLTVVYAVDRTAGPRERDVLRHHGDHSVNMDRLSDSDLEEGERGPDMRDVRR